MNKPKVQTREMQAVPNHSMVQKGRMIKGERQEGRGRSTDWRENHHRWRLRWGLRHKTDLWKVRGEEAPEGKKRNDDVIIRGNGQEKEGRYE